MTELSLFNKPVRVDRDGMICLTDMWKASGKSDAESPGNPPIFNRADK